MFRWFSKFNRGRTSLQDDFRKGRPKSVLFRELLLQNRHVATREIEACLAISSNRIYSILNEHLAAKGVVRVESG